jgi:hypothetical protein
MLGSYYAELNRKVDTLRETIESGRRATRYYQVVEAEGRIAWPSLWRAIDDLIGTAPATADVSGSGGMLSSAVERILARDE